MKKTDELYAVVTLKDWYNNNKVNFQKCGALIRFNDSNRGSAEIQIETNKYLISISTWDHASCLDIQILEIETEISIFPTVGDCETINIFENHLESFLIWFGKEHNCC